MELIPNLHWIEGRISNIYLWVSENGLMLVDSGIPRDAGTILDYVQSIGCHYSEISSILMTHADYDHAGSAALIQEQSSAVIYASARSAELLSRGKSPKHMPRPIHFLMDRLFGYRPVPVEAIQRVTDGDTVPGAGDWQVLAAPGHTPDHYAFCSLEHGVLFAGDALNTRGGRLGLTSERIMADQEAARRSALQLLRLSPAVIACGHGPPLQTHSADELMSLFHQLQNEQVG